MQGTQAVRGLFRSDSGFVAHYRRRRRYRTAVAKFPRIFGGGSVPWKITPLVLQNLLQIPQMLQLQKSHQSSVLCQKKNQRLKVNKGAKKRILQNERLMLNIC